MGWNDRDPWQGALPLADPAPAASCRDAGVRQGISQPGRPELQAAPARRLVYVSRAAPGLGLADVYGIIRTAHAGNAPAGLSGALIFLDGWFVQLLEGRSPALEACFARIRRDPRHTQIGLRLRQQVHRPVLLGQPMALRTRACLDEDLLASFGYRPGFPVDGFPADVLVEFVVQACRRMG